MKKLTVKNFILRANKIHSNKYDYKQVYYKDTKTKVKIICPIHGEFEQMPGNHLNGRGCHECAKNNRIKSNRKYAELFIKKANKTHGDKYDYKQVYYKNTKTDIKIICPTHGVFEQNPSAHISGSGCQKCANNATYDTYGIISKFNIVHNNKYNYSSVEYINAKTKVNIICPIHGVFKQKPNNHLSGQGCPSCNESKGEKEVAKYLDIMNIEYIREYKFDRCKSIYVLPFDFYIPSMNLCIEYDGIQHYRPHKFFGGEKGFWELKKRDEIKNKYCKLHNIKLLRIPYYVDVSEYMINREI